MISKRAETTPRLTIARPTHKSVSPSLTSNAYKILTLLKRGFAYRVRGQWRFRGVRAAVTQQTLLALLSKGLAEQGAAQLPAQMQITDAGLAALKSKSTVK
jgi:hypothetical protein